MKSWQILAFVLTLIAVIIHGINDKKSVSISPDSAGDFTTKHLSTHTFIAPGRGVDSINKLNFWTGKSLFSAPWVIAPSSTKDRDGLGPLFNARSCIACHQGGSRGPVEVEGESIPTSLIIRFGYSTNLANNSDELYGQQLQPRAVNTKLYNKNTKTAISEKTKFQPEAWLSLKYKTIDGVYADGYPYQLQEPSYQLTKLAYGNLSEGVRLSPRYAPNIYGAGLLDAIPEQDLLNQEDIDDTNNDGISAKYNRSFDIEQGKLTIGRFGLKAKQPSLKQQVAAAFRDDIGITNSLFPEESCTEQQKKCIQAANVGQHPGVEIPDKLLKLVVDFNRHLGVPEKRNINNPQYLQGQQEFFQTGCHQCHTPSYEIAKEHPNPLLAGQKIYPYTDLALHDMGSGLADGVAELSATGKEWRTPPLWGIGLQKTIVKDSGFLHDGRARTIEEAILWHGGEAEKSQTKFRQLNKQQRDALLLFVSSI